MSHLIELFFNEMHNFYSLLTQYLIIVVAAVIVDYSETSDSELSNE